MTTQSSSARRQGADEALRQAGLKVTASRRAVYLALGEKPHASADVIFDSVRETVPSSSMQSVYNALGDFVAAGLARRIEPAGEPGLFELRVGDNHHHVVCSSCGAVGDIDCAVGPAPCLTPSETHGFRVDSAEVTFWGLCPDCYSRQSASTPPFETTEAPTQGEG